MEKTIEIVNQMETDGLFERYAIGGGIAALFYIEPITTFDLDIFIILPESSGILVSLSPIYQWLEERGYQPQNEQIMIEGVPVQFIPVYNALIEDAVINAMEQKYGQTTTRVLRPEYLVAIMLQVFRPKDKERLLKFFDEADLSEELLESILITHDLKAIYLKFKGLFYER